MIWLPKYVVSCRLHSSLVLVVVALQMSQMPCWMNSSDGVLGRLWRVLQFGATVAVRSRIHPQGARTIPKIRMPGVRMDMRIHSCVDRLGMIAAALAVVDVLSPKLCVVIQTGVIGFWQQQLLLTNKSDWNLAVGGALASPVRPTVPYQDRCGAPCAAGNRAFFILACYCRDVQREVSSELLLCKCVWEELQKRQRSTFFFCHWAVSPFNVIKAIHSC